MKPRPRPTARAFFASLDDKSLPYVSPHGFAEVATRKELRQAAERLLKETDRRALWRLSSVFRRRDFPLPLRRLLAQAADETRGGAVCRVLENINAPQIRHFARAFLRKRPLP